LLTTKVVKIDPKSLVQVRVKIPHAHLLKLTGIEKQAGRGNCAGKVIVTPCVSLV